MSSTWVMVADGARARLFALDTGVHAVAEIGDYINPGGHGPEDAEDQPPPMATDHNRHASETHGADRDVAATPFARELNAVLQRGRGCLPWTRACIRSRRSAPTSILAVVARRTRRSSRHP